MIPYYNVCFFIDDVMYGLAFVQCDKPQSDHYPVPACFITMFFKILQGLMMMMKIKDLLNIEIKITVIVTHKLLL